jgi:hypothetical protein
MSDAPPPVAARSRLKATGDDGVTILEYVLLLAFVSLVAVGALVYFDKSNASPAGTAQRAASNLGVGVSGGNGTSRGPSPPDWCTSHTPTCTDTIAVNDRQTVHFWASGGVPPYGVSLTGAPRFVSIQDFDASAGSGEVTIAPASCSALGSYRIGIIVNDGESPPSTGTLHFSLTVSGSCASLPAGPV